MNKGQIATVEDFAETVTVIGPVTDQDEHMLKVRWNGSGRITHEYPADVRPV
jgi:hypothetical protein